MENNCPNCKKKTEFVDVEGSKKVRCTSCDTEYHICMKKDCNNLCKFGYCKKCSGEYVKKSNAAIVGGVLVVGGTAWKIVKSVKKF